MIIDYELGLYVGIANLALACVTSVWRGFSAKRTLVALLLSLYIPTLLSLELLPLSLGWDPMLSHDLGIYPISLTLIYDKLGELSSSQIGVFAFDLAKPTLPLLPLGLLAPMMWPRFRNFRKASTLLAMTALGIKQIQLVEDAMMAASSKRVSFDEAFCTFKRGAQGRLLCRRLVLPCHGIRPHRTSVVPPVTQNPLNALRT